MLFRSWIEGNIGFREMFVIVKSAADKKAFIEFYSIENSIAKECFRIE